MPEIRATGTLRKAAQAVGILLNFESEWLPPENTAGERRAPCCWSMSVGC
jgi:hypothetical protein